MILDGNSCNRKIGLLAGDFGGEHAQRTGANGIQPRTQQRAGVQNGHDVLHFILSSDQTAGQSDPPPAGAAGAGHRRPTDGESVLFHQPHRK